MRRLTMVLSMALLASSASAAVRFVGKSGGCSHMTGKTCSTASNCGASFDTACCEVQQGHDSSLTVAGDTLEIHAGTYTSTGATVTAGNWYTNAVPFAARITKALPIVRCASGETYTMDLQATRQGGLWIDVDGVTVDGARCINQRTVNDINRVGCVTFARNAGMGNCANSVLKNSTNVMVAGAGGACTSCAVGFRIQMKGSSAVYNNTVTGAFSTAFISMDGGASGSTTDIHHNTLTGSRPDGGAQTCFITEHEVSGAKVLIHDNSCKVENGGSRFAFPRDNDASIYFWNNYATGPTTALYLQDADDPQSEIVYAFGNTFENCGVGVQWESNAYQAHIRNNIIKCSTAVNFVSCGGSGCVANGVGTAGDTSDFRKNAYSGTLKSNSGGVPEPPTATAANNIASNCALDATTHHLTASSGPCVDVGYNNSIDQGANLCSVSGVSCLPDDGGDVRPKGVGFDVGLDERVSGGTAACGNGAIDAGELCDDGNTVTETACAYGTATCTACRSDCLQVLNLTGPYCGDSIINGSEACDGSNLNGHTCSDFGCSAGVPQCVSCVVTQTGCSSCGAAKADPPWSYDDADTVATIFYLSSDDVTAGGYLVVYGDDFGTAGVVTLNGASAPIVTWSARRIAIQVPSGAAGPVVVTPSGGGASAAYPVTVHAGTVRHLDVNAAAGGNGTAASPYNTFTAAHAVARAGDQVVVHAGTYTTTGDSVFYVTTGGTAGNAITWIAKPGNTVILDGSTALKSALRSDTGYVNFVGFVASGSLYQNIFLNGTKTRAVDCEAKDGNGVVSTKGQGINMTGAFSEALGNYIHDNYSHGFYVHGDDLKIGYNYVASSGCCGAPSSYGYGIQLYLVDPGPTFSRVRVYRNFVTTSNRAGIVVGQYAADSDVYENVTTANKERGIIVSYTAANTKIRNNVSYRNDTVGAGYYEIDLFQGTGATVYNNVMTGPNAIIRRTALSGTVTINSNLYDGATSWSWNGTNYSTLASWRSGSSQDAAGQAANPMFSNAAAKDFRPATGSPLIDTGNDAQCARPVQGAHCDEGGFETSGATINNPPGTTANLRRTDRR